MNLSHKVLETAAHYFTVKYHRFSNARTGFTKLFFDQFKISEFLAIATKLVNTPVWIDDSNNTNAIKFDFNKFRSFKLAFMISTVVSKLTAKDRYSKIWIFTFHHLVYSLVTDTTAQVLDKDTTIPAIPLAVGAVTHKFFNHITSSITGDLSSSKSS